MSVEAVARTLAAGRVGRINEENRAAFVCVLSYSLDAVAFDERDAASYRVNLKDAPLQRCGIPPRRDAFTVLAAFKGRASSRENTAVISSVLQDSLESPFLR